MNKEQAKDVGGREKPLCPIPDTVADDDRGACAIILTLSFSVDGKAL